MSLTPSNMLPLGTVAPNFKLLDAVSGNILGLSELKSDKATVIMFICNHCPYVIHVQEQIVNIAHTYQKKGISFIAISSNDIENYPEDAPEKMRLEAIKADYPFPYLYDETQQVAKDYLAACTPDFYVFDGEMKCVYRGRMDESTPGNRRPNTGIDLRSSLDNILSGGKISEEQFPSVGCNIKWK